MNDKPSKRPKIRFPEFSDDWRMEILGDIATFSKGKGIAKSDIDPNGTTYCVRYGELYTSYDTVIDLPISKTSMRPENLVLSEGGEVIVPASGETAEDISTAAVVLREGIALGGDLNIIRSPLNGGFLASYLSGKKRMALAAMAQGNSVVHLYPSQLATLSLGLPTRPEQDKIASSLHIVDEKISQLSDKLALLEKYKKGCMQRVFSQEIRFSSESGGAFPDWKTRTLGKLASRVKEKNENLDNNNVLTNSAVHGIISQGDYFEHDIANSDNLDRYTIVNIGDFVYNPRISATAPVGPIKRNNIAKGVMSPLYDVFRFAETENTDFWSQYFEFDLWHRYMKQVANYGARHDRMAISTSDFFDMPLPYPHPDEQRKIADFLLAMDAKINLANQELMLARDFKRSLLQQMFV